MASLKKMSKDSFAEQFEIFFGESKTNNSMMQALLRNRLTCEVIPTDIYASSHEYGELLVIETFCYKECN